MVNWQDVEARAARVVDRVFAEDLELHFLTNGRADPSRARTTARGPLRTGRGKEDSPAGRVQSWGARIASGRAVAHITRSTYAGPLPRKGDKVRAIERQGSPWFEIIRVDDRDAARIVLELTEA
jgi:hypothetical protein